MNWRQGLFRLWVVFSLGWLIAIIYLASDKFLKRYPFADDYQYVAQLKAMPWDTDWSKPLYEVIYPPTKGSFSESFAIIEPRDADGFNKAVKDGRDKRIDFPDHSRLVVSAEFTASDRALLTTLFWGQRWWRYWGGIWPWLRLALGPPLGLLLAAFALSWVSRGFVRKSTATRS